MLIIFLSIHLAVCLLQVYLTQGLSFAGISSNLIAWNLFSLFPESGIWAFIKVFIFCSPVTMIWLSLSCFIFFRNEQSLGKRAWISLIPSCAYIIILISSIVRYPSLYETFLPKYLAMKVFKSSFYISPQLLDNIGVFLVLLSLYLSVSGLGLRRIKIGVAFCCLASIIILANMKMPRKSLPSNGTNLLILAADSLRYDRSENSLIMPQLHKLKNDSNSIIFHDHHVGVPRTFPSWTEILEGQYAAKTGIRHTFPGMTIRRHKKMGLAGYLMSHGFLTSVAGDYAGDIFPRFRGGFQNIEAPKLDIPNLIKLGVVQSFPLFYPFINTKLGISIFPEILENPNFADAKFLTQQSISRLEQVKNQKFFHTSFFSTAHFPYAAPWPWYSRFSDIGYEGPFFFQKNPKLSSLSRIGENDINQVRSLYDGAVASIDYSIGEIIDWLKANQLYDSTMIVVTADHGEDLYEENRRMGHGEHLKGENVLKVPLIIKAPKGIKVKTNEIFFNTRSIDIMPTVLSLMERPIPNNNGIDLSPWIIGKAGADPKLVAYSETGIWFSNKGNAFFQKQRLQYPGISGLLNIDPGHSGDMIINPKFESVVVTAKHRSIIYDQYKLIYTPTHKGPLFHLYDRRNDPENKVNIANAFPKKLQFMKDLLLEQIDQIETKYHVIDDFVVAM